MSYLLDTNIISELTRTHPHKGVVSWLGQVPDERLYLSVLSLGEIRKGAERLPADGRRERLRVWLEHDLPLWFGARILPIDKAVADRWGRLQHQAGRNLPVIDSLLAATALHHELRLVTRNLADFSYAGLEVIDPWRMGG